MRFYSLDFFGLKFAMGIFDLSFGTSWFFSKTWPTVFFGLHKPWVCWRPAFPYFLQCGVSQPFGNLFKECFFQTLQTSYLNLRYQVKEQFNIRIQFRKMSIFFSGIAKTDFNWQSSILHDSIPHICGCICVILPVNNEQTLVVWVISTLILPLLTRNSSKFCPGTLRNRKIS